MKILMLACAGLCVATTADASTPQTAALVLSASPGAAPRFGQAYLGMTLAAWKAMPRSPALSPRASPSCLAGDGGQTPASAHQPPPNPQGPVVCSYLARYEALTLTQSLPLTAKYLARDPHYIFTNGRLTAIRFLTSVDAFNALTAQFTQAYGAPKQTVRDNLTLGGAIPLPRVREVWRRGDQLLRLTDPAARPDRLEVDLTKTDHAQGPASATSHPGA